MRASPFLLCLALGGCLVLGAAALHAADELRFSTAEIGSKLTVVYAVTVADMNGDRRPDVVAVLSKRVVWFENPGRRDASWTEHVIADRPAAKDNVCLAVHDVDGDGRLDVALGASWQPANTESGGTLEWLRNPGGGGLWPATPIAEEPTLHRMRWGDVDGDGRKELIVVPLHGRGNRAPEWEGAGLRVLVFRVPARPAVDPWPVEVADESLHIGHNFWVEDDDGDGRDEIWVASREGVSLLRRESDGWKRYRRGAGSPGELKLGRVNRQRVLAAVEPWHGNGLVVYEEPRPALTPQGPAPNPKHRAAMTALWPQRVIEERLASGHAVAWADLDGDGSDELVAGWREGGREGARPAQFKTYGVAIYKRSPEGEWSRVLALDDGGMATEDLAVADLDGDGRVDIIGGGRATQNLRIYWNDTRATWKRHELIADGTNFLTAVASDFTGDGRIDVIASGNGRTVLFAGPEFRPRLIHEGPNLIHAAVMDVNRDGCPDFVGAQYAPGLVLWIECRTLRVRPLDDFAKGGVNGIHGLVTGDVNGDGVPDLVANSAQPKGAFPESIAWFDGAAYDRKTGTLKRRILADRDAPGLSHYLDIGDLDGDGRADVACGAKVPPDGNWFAFWSNQGNGPWRKQLVATGQEGATNVAIADVDGDGRNDLFATRGHGVGAVWYRAPDWTPQEVNRWITGPHALAKGDLDGDGDIDFATVAKDSLAAVWFENDGRGGFRTRVIHENQASYDVRLVDLDGDGDWDLLVAGQGSGNVVWFENRLRAN